MTNSVRSRRLAAIVVTDVVGYTRMMSEDEASTLAALKANRQDIVMPLLEQCGGRLVKLMGDGALFEFASAVDAVRFAILSQTRVAKRNEAVPEPRRIRYRVGIEVGDIAVEGSDIFGDGVNAAARLEAIAEPGGICISNTVRGQVRGKLEIDLEDLGPQRVKNIAEPIPAWRVAMNARALAVSDAPVSRKRVPLRTLALAAAAVVALGTALLVGQSGTPDRWEAPAERKVAASLFVLPFDDLSPEGDLRHFADGMTEDLITDLARWKELNVAARNSTLLYKDKSVDVREVAREMTSDYVLEGTVRPAGERLRVTAQLVNGRSGDNVWAERFDETDADVLALQDRVIQKIVQSLVGNHGVIRSDEYARTWAKADVNLEEYDYYLRGHDLFYRYTNETNLSAISIWEEGLERFPDSGLLRIKLGWGLMVRGMFGWAEDREATFAKVRKLLAEGMADPKLPPAGHRFGLWLRATVSTFAGDYETTIRTAREVAAAYPFDSEGYTYMSDDLLFSGEVDLAGTFIDRTLSLDQRPTPYMLQQVGQVRFGEERYEEAIEAFEAARQNAESTWYLAASHAALGHDERAARYAAKLSSSFPDVTPEFIRTYDPWRTQDVPDRLIRLLAKAGWAPASQMPVSSQNSGKE